MKTLYLPLTVFLLAGQAYADLKIPAAVFRVAKLEDAVKQAKEQKKPLAFLASHEGSRELNNTTEDALKALGEFAVVVYCDAERGSATDINQLAPPFITAFVGAQISVPMAVIGSPAEDDVWDIVSAKDMAGGRARKAIRQSAATVKTKSTPFFAATTPVPPVMPKDKVLIWSKKGEAGHYQASFVRVDGDRIVMSSKEKGEGAMPMEEMHPATVRYVNFLSQGSNEGKQEDQTEEVNRSPGSKPAAEKPATEKPAAPTAAVEKWTNKDGKELQAAFVRLAGGKVTLRSAAGKEYTIPLDTLSPGSQSRAKECAKPAKKGAP
jgi:hypothetical protein